MTPVAMNRSGAASRVLGRALPAAALAALLAAGAARAACTIPPLADDVPQFASTSHSYFSFTQSAAYWAVVAVKPALGDDWDITALASTAPDPTCVSGPLSSSTAGGSALDFVIADFNHTATGTYYIDINRFAGSGSATVQWDDGPDLLPANGDAAIHDFTPTELIRAYDVFLGAGTTYTFDFFPQTSEGFHMLLFRNAAGGTYWAARNSAVLDLTGCGTYTAPSTGYYGVVVTNDVGVWGRYTLGITGPSCDCPAAVGLGVTVSPPSGRYAWEAPAYSWQGIGVRSITADWDLALYAQPSGNASAPCFTGLLANSTGGAGVDLVIGDFNHMPGTWAFANPYYFSGSGGAALSGLTDHGPLSVNRQVTDYVAATELAHVYDVHLESGKSYALAFSPFVAGINLLVFANTGGGTYWAGRASAVVSTSGSTTYTAPVTGEYAVVVVNDAATLGGYILGVGDCSAVTTLLPGIPVTTAADVNDAYFACPQSAPAWTAVANWCSSTDWDLVMNGDATASPWPDCTSLLLASSTQSLPKQDVIVADFNHVAPSTFWVRARQADLGPVTPTMVQWDSGHDVIVPNAVDPTTGITGASQLVACWDIFLNFGQAYEFDLVHGGPADVHMLLFQNSGGGAYRAGRGAAVMDVPGSTTIYAPGTGWFGFVLVNDNGGPGSYSISVKTCDPPVALSPAPAVLAATAPATFVQFSPSTPFWTPVAVRPDNMPEDWDLFTYSTGTGGGAGTCFTGALANSSLPFGKTDYVVGDFNYNPLGTYYAIAQHWTGGAGSRVQWFAGVQSLPAGGAHAVRTKPESFLVESWDALLVGGAPYTLLFSHDVAFDVKASLFPSMGGVRWVGRGGALFETGGSVSFTAPSSGWAGIVVVSDGGAGSFDIALANSTLAADATPRPASDALGAISPNPGRGGMRFDFALHDPAAVSFEVMDMAGRVVSRLEPLSRGTGSWSEAWTARDARGRPLAAGLYFVRMRVGDRTVGMRKMTLLE